MELAPQEIRTFFVTSITNGRKSILQSRRMAGLFMDVLQENRKKSRFLLHEFVVMPDHFHLLITPAADVSLEKAGQFIKGGFSFRAKKELRFALLIWQESFTNHRIRDVADYEQHRNYIHQNPVRKGLAKTPSEYPYSSAFSGMELDPAPPALKRKI
jgi:putative transposase